MKAVDDILDSKIKLFGIEMRAVDLFFATVVLLLGIAVRMSLFDIESGDYHYFLSVWMKECHDAGGIGYLGITPGISDESTINYGWMYQYVIVLLHYLWNGSNDMFLLKAVSVIFDVVCAVTVFRIAYMVTEGNTAKTFLAFSLSMLLPTFVMNSGSWAQCDSIYSSFALLSVLHFLKKNDNKVFIYFALSYCFKQQVIFILPLLVIMWLKGKVRFRYVFWVPVIRFLTMIPALIAGREFTELVGIYGKQRDTYSYLTMNYPNVYSLINSALGVETREAIISAGIMASLAIMGVIAYYIRSRRFAVTSDFAITLLIFTAEVCLFTLPIMHERYGYIPEMAAIIYGVTRYKRMAVCIALQFVSVITYARFLYGTEVSEIWPLSIILMAVIFFVGYDLNEQMKKPEAEL